MATLRAIRKRISSVRNTSKITKAMKMVSAAKLRRAQQAIENLRPYATELTNVVKNLSQRIEDHQDPLLQARPVKNRIFLIITSDRGLCGSFNSGILRKLEAHLKTLKEAQDTFVLFPVGRKGFEFFRKRDYPIQDQIINYQKSVSHAFAVDIALKLMGAYQNSEVDEVYIVYNEFVSTMTQRFTLQRLLPVEFNEEKPNQAQTEARIDFIYEPGKEKLLKTLLPRYVETLVFRALLESLASEHGARMTSMDSASNNALKMINSLTIQMNRARQAAITTELMDIINGAESLK